MATLLAFGAGFGLTWWQRETVFGWLTAPAGGLLSPHEDGLPVYTSLTEVFSSTARLSAYSGLIVAFPVAVLSIYYLARPHLSRKQRRTVATFTPLIVLLFLAGTAFAYWVMLPTGIKFLIAFGDGVAVPTIRISEYMKIVVAMIFWLGVIAEIPLVMYVLAKAKIVSHEGFKRIHRIVPWFAMIFGAIITPSLDIVNMLLVAIPIYLLYRVGLLLAWLAQPGKGRLVIRGIKAVLVGVLRRLTVVLLLPPSLILKVLYVAALSIVEVVDGDYSTETPSRSKAWVDRAYLRMHRELARVARVG